MKGFLLSLVLYVPTLTFAQDTFNLDFSDIDNQQPKGWYIEGSEPGMLSTEHPTNNGQSLRLSRNADTGGDSAFAIQMPPFQHQGKELTLTGWIKTREVTGDGASLWLAINAGSSELAHDNMKDRQISGSQDWQQVQVSVQLTDAVDSYTFGVVLAGTGEAFFADLSIKLDGVPITEVPKVSFAAAAVHPFEQESGIRITELNAKQQQNLLLLGKVWGFIKYYHPASARGEISMDAELFRLLPAILNADNTKRDQLLANWINALGELPPCQRCKSTAEAALVLPDQFWHSWGLSAELSQLLARVFNSELPSRHYWVRPEPNVGNPFFNEKSYTNVKHEDSGFRLLALFRLWNIIQYYSPYRDLVEQPWEQVLEHGIAAVINAKSKLEYQLALAAVIYAINDTHSQFSATDNQIQKSYVGEKMPPLEVRFVENQAVVFQVYQENLPIQVGDVITHINDQTISDRLAYLKPVAAASNEPTRLRQFAEILLATNSNQTKIQLQRDAASLEVQLDTIKIKDLKRQYYYQLHGDTAYHHITPDIGYIRLDKIAGVNIDNMMQQLADTRGLVLDIRNYPGDFVVFSLGQHLYPEAHEFVRFSAMAVEHPGKFVWTPALSIGSSNPNHYKGKIAILINEQTQSMAEYTTMAFRGAPKAKVFGSTTAGADGNLSYIVLPGGYWTGLSGIGVFYPDKTPTQRVGIVPDVFVTPTVAGIKAGRDEVLDQALQYLQAD